MTPAPLQRQPSHRPGVPARKPAVRAHAGTRPQPNQAGAHGGRCSCGGTCPRCAGAGAAAQPAVAAAGGEPLSMALRQRFEPRFGADFSAVRVHRDAAAQASARSLAARAYTVGSNIVFGAGAYAPQSRAGQHLLAHELTHTLQQRSAQRVQRLAIGTPGDAHEREADASADAVMSGRPGPIPSPSPLSVQRVQRTTDASFEAGGVGTGITAATLSTVAGVHGSGFDAANCFGVDGCNVHFTFEKAYKGTYPYAAAGGRNVRGVYVKIVARPDDNCWSCNQLEIVQVLRNTTMASGALVTADPGTDMRRQRSGWSDASAPSRGWRVDRLESARNPFYSQGPSGQSGDFRTPAILWDAPGDWDTDRNAGKDFQSCLVCVSGSSRIALGCVTWGYYIDTAGAVSFRPQPAATCSATTQLRDAAQRWDTLPGHQDVDLGTSSPGRPAGETPRPIPPGGKGIG